MSQVRKIGVMVDSKDIQHNLGQMSDTIRNANYKMLEAKNIKPNEDGEYLDEEGDNLLMSEEDVTALLQDAMDNYLVASVPGSKNHNPQEFQYYLMDSFPNVAEQLQSNPAANTYISALFASTCGMLAAKLTPAIQDIVASDQMVGSIEVFNTGPHNSFYILQGEVEEVVEGKDFEVVRLSKEERQAEFKAGLLQELGPEGYAQYQRDQEAIKLAERYKEEDDAFGRYGDALAKAFREDADAGYPSLKNSLRLNPLQRVTTRYYSSSIHDPEAGIKTEPTLDLIHHRVDISDTSNKLANLNEPLLFPDT